MFVAGVRPSWRGSTGEQVARTGAAGTVPLTGSEEVVDPSDLILGVGQMGLAAPRGAHRSSSDVCPSGARCAGRDVVDQVLGVDVADSRIGTGQRHRPGHVCDAGPFGRPRRRRRSTPHMALTTTSVLFRGSQAPRRGVARGGIEPPTFRFSGGPAGFQAVRTGSPGQASLLVRGMVASAVVRERSPRSAHVCDTLVTRRLRSGAPREPCAQGSVASRPWRCMSCHPSAWRRCLRIVPSAG